MPASSRQMLALHAVFPACVPKILSPARNNFIERVFKEYTLQTIACMPGGPPARPRLRFVDVTTGAENLEGQVLKQMFSSFRRQMSCVVGKGTDLVRHTSRSPACMNTGGNRINTMMHVD